MTPAPLRILFVADSIREPVTGVGRVALTILRELVELGADVVAVDHEDNALAREICGVCHVLPIRGAFLRMGRWHLHLLRRLATLNEPDAVLFDPTGYPNVYGEHPRQAILVHDLSMFEKGVYRRGKRTWFRVFYERALHKAQLRICVSEHTRQQLLARFDLPESGSAVVPNSIDPDFARAPEGTPHAAMPAAPFLLVVGTIERRKNTDRLLTAYAATDVDLPLVLAGRPGSGSERTLARAAKLGDRVIPIHGATDEQLRHLYRNAHALLFPSLDEGFGLPILEAMQCDLPVLTSNVSAMPEVAGDAALLVDPTDTTAIRDGIQRLATDAALRQELITKGRANLSRFSARTNAKALLKHLQSLR